MRLQLEASATYPRTDLAHRDLRSNQVLWVIASGVNDRIFDQRGARAIIQLAWREAELSHFIAFLVVPRRRIAAGRGATCEASET